MSSKRQQAIEKLREVLLRRRDALRKALAGDLNALRELRSKSGGDWADIAADAAQDEMSCQLAEVEARELAQIEAALERMRNGTYGICEVTGKPIPLARLQALPYATMCIEAQRELEKQMRSGRRAIDWGRVADAVRDFDEDEDSEAILNDLESD
jgi:DnaK suppressor protein